MIIVDHQAHYYIPIKAGTGTNLESQKTLMSGVFFDIAPAIRSSENLER